MLPMASFDSQALASATFVYTYNSAAGAKAIPNPGSVQVPIPVGASVTATRVDVSVGITHGRSGDLNVWVASPAGVQQQIVWAGGNVNPNIYQTFPNLNLFIGAASFGTWSLWVQDTVANGFSGSVDYWTLMIYYTLSSDIQAPLAGATLVGNSAISVRADSAAAVTLSVDDQLVSSMNYNSVTSRWEYTLNTTIFPDGAHSIIAAAHDLQNNEVTDSRAVNFDNWNVSVVFGNPPVGGFMSATYTVTCTIVNVSVKGELYVNDELVGVDTTLSGGQYSVAIDTTKFHDGNYNLRWIVYDPDGNTAVAMRGTVIDNYQITCTIASPASGSQVINIITIAATVSSSAVYGNLYLDSNFIGQDTTKTGNQFTYPLDTRFYPDGPHTISVVAYDPDGASAVGVSNVAFNNTNMFATISSPGTGSPLVGNYTVWINTASYAVKGELYVDGALYAVNNSLTSSGGLWYFMPTLVTRNFSDGTHRLTAIAYDTWGESAAQTLTYTFDNYAISVSFTSPGAGAIVSGPITVSASVPASAAAYAVKGELYIDDALVDVDTSLSGVLFSHSVDTRNFYDGMRVLREIVYDPDGNTAAAVRTVTFDNWQISVTLSTVPSGTVFSGTVQVFGTVPSYATYGELYVDDTLIAVNSTKDLSNRFLVRLDTSMFPDGKHNLKWIVYDPGGSAATALLAGTFNNYNLSSIAFNNLPATISSRTAAVRVTVPAFAVLGELYVDNVLVSTDNSPSSGNYDFSVDTTAFHDGVHTISVKVYDPFGKYGTAIRAVTIDNYQIFCTMVAPTSGQTISATFTVRATVPDYALHGDLYIDGGFYASTTTHTSGEFRFGLDTKTLKDGSHSISVVAFDPDGNAASAAVTANVDNYQISASLVISPGGSPMKGNQTMYAYTQLYAIKGEFYIDGALVWTDYLLTRSGSLYYFDYMQDTTKLKDGSHTFRVVSYDPDGNAAAVQTTADVDNWQISVTITAPATGSVRSKTIAVTASVPAYARRGELLVDGALYGLAAAPSGGAFGFVLDTRGFSDGWHSIGVRAYDPDGESAFQSVSVLMDNTAPKLGDLTVIYPPGQGSGKNGDYVSISVWASDAGGSGLSAVWCDAANLGGGGMQMLDDGIHNDSSFGDGVFGSGGIRLSTTMGTHFAFITATDLAGNAATASAKVGVDTHDPLITTSYCVYPIAQTAAKLGDSVRIVSKVLDLPMTVDTVLVIDTSGSMSRMNTTTGRIPINDAKSAAKTFIGGLGASDRAAVYSFNNPPGSSGSSPRLEIGFTSTKASLNSTIDALSADDWTPLYDTVYAAIQYAKTSPNMPMVIVLTDGNDELANGGHSSHALSDCKNASIPVYTIGLDPYTGPGGYAPINETVLKDIAYSSDGGSYYHAPSSAQLQQIYQDLANIVAKMDVGGISRVYCDCTPVGGPAYVAMYDDGAHNDLAVGDGYFGSDPITIGIVTTANVQVTVTALDGAGNRDTDIAVVRVDNSLPAISNLNPRYRPGQWWAADNEIIAFSAQVMDFGDPRGIRNAELDASSVGGSPAVAMKDDGAGNDMAANDGIYTSASVTVSTGSATRFFTFKVTAWDNASNSAAQSGNIYVDNGRPLAMNITSPAQGQYTEGLLTTRVQVTDQAAIASLELTLAPPGTVYRTSFNALTGYYEIAIDTTALADGAYSLGASGLDIAGRALPRPASVAFFVDNHSPVLKVNSPRNGDYLSGSVLIDTAGTSDIFLLAVEYNVDGTGWVPVATAWDTTSVPDGQHSLAVRATDNAGHASQQAMTVTVDNTDPTCRIIVPGDGDILEGKVTVRVKSSDRVGVSRIDLSGAAAAEAEYNPVSGYYEWDLDTRELADGNYTLGATALDDFGHSSIAAPVSFTVDNNAPSLTVLGPKPSDYVSEVVLVQAASSDGPFTDLLRVEYKVDERSWTVMTQDNGTWVAYWDTTEFSDGAHTMSLRSADIAGHEASQTFQLTVDNHAPSCRIYSPLPGQYIEGRQLFQVLAQDDVGIVYVTIDISDVGSYLMSYNGYTGYYEYSMMTTGLGDGMYNLTVSAVDCSGRTTAVGPLPFNIDNIAPSFTLVKPKEGDAITDNITVVLAWTGGRSGPGDVTVRYRIDTGAWIPANVSTSADSLADGAHTITVRAEDPAGHVTEVVVHVFIDKGMPQLTVVSPKPNAHVADAVALKLRAKDAAGITSVRIALGNGTPEEVFLNSVSGYYESELYLAGMPDGQYIYCVTAADEAGHAVTTNLTVTLDTSGPQLALGSPSGGGDMQGRIKFAVQASDPSGLASVSISLRSGDWRQMRLAASGDYIYTWDTTAGDDGVHTVEIRAVDKLGNEAVSTYEVSIRNRVPNFLNDNFNWLILLVLILGFVGVGATIAWTGRRPKYMLAAQMAEYRAAPSSKAPDVPAPAPAETTARDVAAPPPVPPPTPLPPSQDRIALQSRSAGDEVPFEEEEDEIFMEPAPAPRRGLSIFGKKEAPAPRGGAGASLAAAAGVSAAAPPAQEEGFEEITDEEQVETVTMEQAWMPRGSLPPAAEMPSRISPAPSTRVQGAAFGRPSTSPDMWEEEEEEGWEEEPAAPDARVPGTGYRVPRDGYTDGRPSSRTPAPGTRYPAPGSRGVSPLDQMLFMPNTKVTRTDEERRMRGPPPGWTHPRPAELMKEAPPPQKPSKPSFRDEVVPTPAAMKPVPPSAQKMSKKDREKMSAMLDDLLVKSKKR
jgi:subtilisin-like proprotein convertase family protein